MSAASETKPGKFPTSLDPAQIAKSFARAAEGGSCLLGEFVSKQVASGKSIATDEFGIARAYMDMAARRAAWRGFGKATEWGSLLILLIVGYAVFTITMHVPWIAGRLRRVKRRAGVEVVHHSRASAAHEEELRRHAVVRRGGRRGLVGADDRRQAQRGLRGDRRRVHVARG